MQISLLFSAALRVNKQFLTYIIMPNAVLQRRIQKIYIFPYITKKEQRLKESLSSRKEASKWHNYLNYEGPCPGQSATRVARVAEKYANRVSSGAASMRSIDRGMWIILACVKLQNLHNY